jgi:hypothetical protein
MILTGAEGMTAAALGAARTSTSCAKLSSACIAPNTDDASMSAAATTAGADAAGTMSE